MWKVLYPTTLTTTIMHHPATITNREGVILLDLEIVPDAGAEDQGPGNLMDRDKERFCIR
ncbi:hypothetical protein KTT_39910 [Tengunoibacter tsumagoiensis]|uniref:Uncharacterized protein n=1 Tax=Tengunoibacter tsumagoiensis TaxID=2014871 RepID=A0A402A4V2_9CHLR|nr:hypothetical protein KTT_39910 [Tengunoibacter tsumagoiensis]